PKLTYVCDDIACRIKGAGQLHVDGEWKHSPCLGQCERPPAALVIEAGARPRAYSFPEEKEPAIPQIGQPGLRLLKRIGRIDPVSLDAYRKDGGYAALRRAIELGPEGVIREVLASNLLGRGGAAFPTGRKWDAVAKVSARPHYVVCNADESEPGTFKDRI